MSSTDPRQSDHDGEPSKSSSHGRSSSKSQFIYPVRSLLSGVQPAGESPNSLPTPPGSEQTPRSSQPIPSSPSSQGFLSKSPSEELFSPGKTLLTFSSLSSLSEEKDGFFAQASSQKGDTSKSSGSNVPIEGSQRPETGTTLLDDVLNLQKQPEAVTQELVVAQDRGGVAITSQGDRDPEEYSGRHPAPLSQVAADALLDLHVPESFGALAMGGYVHLGPSSGEETSVRGSGQGSGGSGSFYRARARQIQAGSATGSGRGSRNSSTRQDDGQEMGSEADARPLSPIQPSERSSLSHAPVNEQLISFRFEHVQTEEGHHLLMGREGKLVKCEDEPIRVPGAVQGFGVLIAVEEDLDSGNLVVRQVSENAREIIGLSPKYLFSLDCFTDTLPESQAETLWQNTEYLYETDTQNNEAPQVFLLSGWGEPNSAFPNDKEFPDPQKRRRWTCWCAAHRPPGNNAPNDAASQTSGNDSPASGASRASSRNLIVLELELENDILNPLYPPPAPIVESPASTPGRTTSSSGESDVKGSATDSLAGSTVTLTSIGEDTSGTGDRPAVTQASSNLSSRHGDKVSFQQGLSSNSGRKPLAKSRPLFPTPEDIFESTTNHAKPILTLERMRRTGRLLGGGQGRIKGKGEGEGGKTGRGRRRGGNGGGTMDVFAVLAQLNEQLGAAQDLSTFLKIAVGIVKDITQFHRILIYQFDEQWNGQVVAELVDWSQTHELYNTLHFPASDIPPQARELYAINKVRLLYDRDQTTARLVVRDKSDLDRPLDMTHSFLRAMSPIHVKYLGNMKVRASMSVSIMTFGALWGLITCHSFGDKGMRVSFPVRQMLRLLSDSVSRNIERLSYAQRLHTRKLISTIPTDEQPSGYIVTNAEDLLGLFDADYGVLVIGDGAKILGPSQHGQEILIISEYLRLKQFKHIQASHVMTKDFPDLNLSSGLEVVAGLLYVPLTSGGKDFIAFLRRGQLRDVHWAGQPFKDPETSDLEPRKSFAVWSEKIAGRCRAWTDEQLETAGVLSLVYGKFIEVWRQKESALATNQLTNIILSNASHEVRTPLNHIINYLEMAMNGSLDAETRENLMRSHAASKGLLFTINDLLDLTRLESGGETSFKEPFNLRDTIKDAVNLYSVEARRRKLEFNLDIAEGPEVVVGDARKIRTVIANLTANAIKFTKKGSVTIKCKPYQEPKGLRSRTETVVEVEVSDTGCGIPSEKLETLFREFEQVDIEEGKPKSSSGLGLGLAVTARIIEQLGGQLRVESKVAVGSRFSFLVPFSTTLDGNLRKSQPQTESDSKFSTGGSGNERHPVVSMSGGSSRGSEIDSLIEALSNKNQLRDEVQQPSSPTTGQFTVQDSKYPVRALKMDEFGLEAPLAISRDSSSSGLKTVESNTPLRKLIPSRTKPSSSQPPDTKELKERLRCLVVEDDKINRNILCKRLRMDGHEVAESTDGQEAVERIEKDRAFDCILMDIQMPILDGFEATEYIRAHEKANLPVYLSSRSRLPGESNHRIPIFAVSASLRESQRETLVRRGMDGWILKPIDFKRLRAILRGINDRNQRKVDLWHPGCNWESGGWLHDPDKENLSATSSETQNISIEQIS